MAVRTASKTELRVKSYGRFRERVKSGRVFYREHLPEGRFRCVPPVGSSKRVFFSELPPEGPTGGVVPV